MSSISFQGGSNRNIYDECQYKQWLIDNNNPYNYMMYQGNYENVHKNRFDKFYHPYDLVDVESELRNQTRILSNCGNKKYNPNMKNKCVITDKTKNNIPYANVKCPKGVSTFDDTVPKVAPYDLNPIVYNNIPKRSCPGYVIPNYL